MRNSDIRLSDWHRLLLGKAPASFLLEVLLRVIAIYMVLLLVVRLLGKRMSRQLSNLELAVMIALGAIVSSPTQVVECAVLVGVVLLLGLLALQRGLGLLTARSARAERVAFGRGTTIVRNGIMDLEAMRDACSPFAAAASTSARTAGRPWCSRTARWKSVRWPATPSRASGCWPSCARAACGSSAKYRACTSKTNGAFSLVRCRRALAGLSIVPPWDPELAAAQEREPNHVCCRQLRPAVRGGLHAGVLPALSRASMDFGRARAVMPAWRRALSSGDQCQPAPPAADRQ